MPFLITDYNWPYQDCSKFPLGMENKAIPDTSFISSQDPQSNSTYPRLGSPGGWCPSSSALVYFKVSLRAPHLICAIGTQGHSGGNGYVTTYKIELAITYSDAQHYMENGAIKASLCVYKIISSFIMPSSKSVKLSLILY